MTLEYHGRVRLRGSDAVVLGAGVELVSMDEFVRLCGDVGGLSAWCEGTPGAALEPFVTHTFTPAELAQASERYDPALYLAGRFAAKLAVCKALALGASEAFDLRVIETLDAPSGAPRVSCSAAFAAVLAKAGAHEVLVSITNEDPYVLAFALAQ